MGSTRTAPLTVYHETCADTISHRSLSSPLGPDERSSERRMWQRPQQHRRDLLGRAELHLKTTAHADIDIKDTASSLSPELLESLSLAPTLSAPARLGLWDKLVRHAISHSRDPTPFLIRKANVLFEVHAINTALRVCEDVRRFKTRRDPALEESLGRLDEALEIYDADRQHDYESFGPVRHYSRPVGGMNKYKDVNTMGQGRVGTHCQEGFSRNLENLASIESCGKDAIRSAITAKLSLTPEQSDRFFGEGIDAHEATKVASVLLASQKHGTTAESSELAAESHTSELDDAHEAYTLINAFARRAREDPTSLTEHTLVDLIRRIHAVLSSRSRFVVQGNTTFMVEPGEYRRMSAGCEDVTYCSPRNITSQMRALAAHAIELLRDPHVHPIALGAWMHHNLAQVHPFADGNGRVARLVASLPALIRSDVVLGVRPGESANLEYNDACLRAEGVNRIIKKQPRPMELLPMMDVLMAHTTHLSMELKDACLEQKHFQEETNVVATKIKHCDDKLSRNILSRAARRMGRNESHGLRPVLPPPRSATKMYQAMSLAQADSSGFMRIQ